LTLRSEGTPADETRRGVSPDPGAEEGTVGDFVKRAAEFFEPLAAVADYILKDQPKSASGETVGDVVRAVLAVVLHPLNPPATSPILWEEPADDASVTFEIAFGSSSPVGWSYKYGTCGPPPPSPRSRRQDNLFVRVTGFSGQDSIPGPLGILTNSYAEADALSADGWWP
jgi:hypothetical protein